MVRTSARLRAKRDTVKSRDSDFIYDAIEDGEGSADVDFVAPSFTTRSRGMKRKRGETYYQRKSWDDDGGAHVFDAGESPYSASAVVSHGAAEESLLGTSTGPGFFGRTLAEDEKELAKLPFPDFYVEPNYVDSSSTRITKSRAKGHGLRDADLWDMDCLERPNPHYRSAAPMRLYLVEEVNEVLEAKAEDRRKRLEEKLLAERQRRVEKLVKKGLRHVDIAPNLRDFVFGDHLTAEYPKFGHHLVIRQSKAARRVQRLFRSAFWKASIVIHFMSPHVPPEKKKKKGKFAVPAPALIREVVFMLDLDQHRKQVLLSRDLRSVIESFLGAQDRELLHGVCPL